MKSVHRIYLLGMTVLLMLAPAYPALASAAAGEAWELTPTATPAPAVTADSGIGFHVRAKIPANQVDKKQTYFDLLLEPGQAQTLQVEIFNESSSDIIVEVEANTASTNSYGVINYLDPVEPDETLRMAFDTIAQVVEREVHVPAHGSAMAAVHVQMPRERMQGHLLGGIVFRKQVSATQEGTSAASIQNIYTYVIAVAITEGGAEVAPNLELLRITPEMVAHKASLVHYIRNPLPIIMTGMNLTMDIYRNEVEETVLHEEQAVMDMAPNTVMAYAPRAEDGTIAPGDYRSVTRINWQEHEWVFEGAFTIAEEEARSMNERVIVPVASIPKEPNAYLILLIVLLILLIILLVWLLVWLWRKAPRERQAKETEKKKPVDQNLSLVLVGALILSCLLPARAEAKTLGQPETWEAPPATPTKAQEPPAQEGLPPEILPLEESVLELPLEIPATLVLESTAIASPTQPEMPPEIVLEGPVASPTQAIEEGALQSPEYLEIVPLQLELDSTSVIVYTASELKTALTGNNSYTTIYLGDHISTNEGATLPSGKPNMTICGRPPGSDTRYSYTNTGSGESRTFVIGNGQTLLLQDMDGSTNNAYGLVSGSGTAIFENAICDVIQLAYMPQGTLVLRDSNITVSTQELAEISNVEFAGATTINKTGRDNAIIWMRNAGEVRVKQGAEVSITTASYFLYISGTASFIVEENAAFSLTTNANGFTYNNHVVADFRLEDGSSFSFLNNNSATHAAVQVAKSFYAGPSSRMDIEYPAGRGAGISLGNDASLIFENPARARIYAGQGGPVSFGSRCILSLSAQSVNVWQSASGIADASAPTVFWNKRNGALCTITSTDSYATMAHNILAEDPVDILPDKNSCNLTGAALLVLGQYALDLGEVTNISEIVYGVALPKSSLQLAYADADGNAQNASDAADAAGAFAISITPPPLLESTLWVSVASGQVYARQSTIVQDGSHLTLRLTVPGRMEFGTLRIAPAGTVYPRQEARWGLLVEDGRNVRSNWSLQVRVCTPLEAAGGISTLENALVYKQDGSMVMLSETPYALFSQPESAPAEAGMEWAADEGILFCMPQGPVQAATAYTGALEWALVTGP